MSETSPFPQEGLLHSKECRIMLGFRFGLGFGLGLGLGLGLVN